MTTLKNIASAKVHPPGRSCSTGSEVEGLLVADGFGLLSYAPEGFDLAGELMKLRNGHDLSKHTASSTDLVTLIGS